MLILTSLSKTEIRNSNIPPAIPYVYNSLRKSHGSYPNSSHLNINNRHDLLFVVLDKATKIIDDYFKAALEKTMWVNDYINSLKGTLIEYE